MNSTDQDSSTTAYGPPLPRLLRYARPFRRQIVWATSCSILNKIFDLAPPLIIGVALDVVVKGKQSIVAEVGIIDPFNQLIALAIATVVIWSLESLFEWLLGIAWRNLAQGIQHETRMDVYSHVQDLEMRWFEDQSTGGLLAILSDDVNQLERFLDGGANEIIQLFVTSAVVTAMFFLISPEIAWLSMIPVPLVIIGSLWFQKRLQPHYSRVRETVGTLNARLANAISGIGTVKSFTAEMTEIKRLHAESLEYADRNRKAIMLSAAFSPLIRIVVMIGFLTTLLYGGWLTLEGNLEAGAYATLVFLIQRLLWPLTRVGSILDLYQRAMASTRRVLDLLEISPTIIDGDETLSNRDIDGRIQFKNVGFGYDSREPILEDFNLDCPAGTTTAIVGSTGCGKSTLVKLLLRFYDVQSGDIQIDSRAIRTLKLRDLRRSIALVSQDVYLFDGTIHENIAYGWQGIDSDPSHWTQPTYDQVVDAARQAEAHEFISTMPDGYETIVGERGQKLSGGQRQRIAMARAVLKNSPILVLDEATASVDNETEAAIQRSLQTLCRDRTTIVIAHRLSTVRNAHRIHVLGNGTLLESGTHDDLIANDGHYARLWNVQTGLSNDLG
ncbi:MAG: ABC transporter ATP-binding protein [Phycisphaerales bacterium]|nr:ABC transporter ATP-binding protein [Phycisphaerales bacterium]